MNNTELGAFGERLAEKHLRLKGFNIIDRNYRAGKLEIDLVAEHEEKLIVIEVKTRNTAEIGEPWRAVTKAKQRQLIKAANIYIFSRNVDKETRFDIVSIVHNSYRTTIEHIEDAFGPSLK
jgi:putative endonuclease